MSRSWLDRLAAPIVFRIAASEASVSYEGEAKRYGTEITEVSDVEVPAWKHCLRHAEQDLAALRLPRWKRRVRAVVGNDLVRYALLPWTEQRLDRTERLQYARVMFEERYGRDHGACVIAIEPPRFGMPTLAAAIDRDIVDELGAAMARCRLRLSSLAPAVVDRIDACRTSLRDMDAGWVVDASDSQLVMLAFANGRWLRVSSRRSGGDSLLENLRRDAIAFPALLDGKVLLAGELADGIAEWPVISLGALA